jgi:uncharacterized protein YcfJ
MKTSRIALATVATLSTFLMAPGVSLASGSGYVDRADVVAVQPLVRHVKISTPRQECWDETVSVYQPPAARTYTPEIFGSILGAAVGNQFGSGSGRDIATVAGAVLGGSLGHDVKNRRAQAGGHTYETVQQRCETVVSEHVEERIDGYDVTYRYNGREYLTRMPHDPGSTIRVRVAVSPLD